MHTIKITNDNPQSAVEVMSAITGGDLTQLFIDQSNLHHTKNAQQWKVLFKSLKWSDVTPEEMKKYLGPIILMGQVRKDNIRDNWSTDPTVSTPILPITMSRN
jgi:hypothetical protein